MAAIFNLTAAMDKPSYNQGDVMTCNVSGVVTSDAGSADTLTINIKAADGSTTALSATAMINGLPETWSIDSVTDTGGRTWTVSSDGHSASATA